MLTQRRIEDYFPPTAVGSSKPTAEAAELTAAGPQINRHRGQSGVFKRSRQRQRMQPARLRPEALIPVAPPQPPTAHTLFCPLCLFIPTTPAMKTVFEQLHTLSTNEDTDPCERVQAVYDQHFRGKWTYYQPWHADSIRQHAELSIDRHRELRRLLISTRRVRRLVEQASAAAPDTADGLHRSPNLVRTFIQLAKLERRLVVEVAGATGPDMVAGTTGPSMW
jgi:hypothetical protein